MYKKGLVDSWYSFAIGRPPNNATSGTGGWLRLGELPPVSVSHSGDWAIEAIEVTDDLPDVLTGGNKEITIRTLAVDGVTWGHGSKASFTISTSFRAVVDTGNQLNLFPSHIAESINRAFNPPAVYDEDALVYFVD